MSIERLKREAKKMKKGTGLTHSECLDIIAREHGYSTWARLVNREQVAKMKMKEK